MGDEENIMNEDNNDDIIDDFCQKVNSEEFKGILSAKEIHSNFESMNEILETLNETKIFYENPQLRIINSIKPKLHIITPKKDLIKEDHDSIKDIKIFQNGYEESADEIISTVENVKINFADLSKSVKGLIDAIEQTKIEYFDTLLNKTRIAIPDFYLPDTNEIVEIKSDFTLDIQEMLDKFGAYKNLGYIPKLILEHKEVSIYNIENEISKDRIDKIKTGNIKRILLTKNAKNP